MRVFGPITPVVQAAARYELLDFVSREPTLEETFLAQYGDQRARRRRGHDRPSRTAPGAEPGGRRHRPGAGSTASAASMPRPFGTRGSRSSSCAGLVGGMFLLAGGAAFGRPIRHGRVPRRARDPRDQPAAGRWPASTATRSRPRSRRWAARSPGRAVGRSGSWRRSGPCSPCPARSPARRAAAAWISSPRPRSGMRRIAIEKLFAHLTGMAIVVAVAGAVRLVAGAAFNTLPGDEISVGRRRRLCGLARRRGACLRLGRVRAGAVRSVAAASAAIAGAVLLFGYFVNGYQGAVPGLRAGRQPHLVGLDGALPAADRPVRLAAARCRARWSRSSCSSSASSCSRVATSALTSRIPWPSMPAVAARPPRSGEPIVRRAPAARGLVGDRDRPVRVRARRRRPLVLARASANPRPRPCRSSRACSRRSTSSGAGGFLELTFIMFGFILAGFAASTLVNGWASDETSGRLEVLLGGADVAGSVDARRRARCVRGGRRADAPARRRASASARRSPVATSSRRSSARS